MKAIVLIFLLCFSTPDLAGQSAKRKKRITDEDFKRQVESPCGVKQSFDDWLEETRVEWRKASVTKDVVYYYGTRRIVCDAKTKTLKAWVKGERTKNEKPITVSMTRYELNCRTDQLRTLSGIDYFDSGEIRESYTATKPNWTDVVPDSVGERILATVCRKVIW